MLEKNLDQKDQVNFKIRDVTTWLTKNYNTHIAHISWSKDNQTMKLGELIEYNKRDIFFKNYAENKVGWLALDLFIF